MSGLPDDAQPRRRPKQRRSERRVERLLDAAAHLFAERGFERTTTNAVAEQAGVSIGTLYQYFPNKAALLQALNERSLVRLRGLFAEVTVDPGSLEATISGLLAALQTFLTNEHHAFRQLTTPYRSRATVAFERAFERELAERVCGLLEPFSVPLEPGRREVAAWTCVRTVWALLAFSADDEGLQREVHAQALPLLRAYLGDVLRP